MADERLLNMLTTCVGKESPTHVLIYDDQPKSLKQTVESLGLVWQGNYHRGIEDARNVASIVKEILG